MLTVADPFSRQITRQVHGIYEAGGGTDNSLTYKYDFQDRKVLVLTTLETSIP